MLRWRLENKKTFYDTLVKWWSDWNFPIVGYSSLPERIFVVSHDDTDLYAVPVYVGDSDMCWIGFITGNKETTKKQRTGALDYVLDKIETCMKYNGYNIILTVSGTPSLKKLFENNNYNISSGDTNEYVKRI
jgi:hypothetical protein